jgi:hypothetical protein
VQGISDIITIPGLVNVDFADVKAIMCNSGTAMLGVGVATGKNRAEEAALVHAAATPCLSLPFAQCLPHHLARFCRPRGALCPTCMHESASSFEAFWNCHCAGLGLKHYAGSLCSRNVHILQQESIRPVNERISHKSVYSYP